MDVTFRSREISWWQWQGSDAAGIINPASRRETGLSGLSVKSTGLSFNNSIIIGVFFFFFFFFFYIIFFFFFFFFFFGGFFFCFFLGGGGGGGGDTRGVHCFVSAEFLSWKTPEWRTTVLFLHSRLSAAEPGWWSSARASCIYLHRYAQLWKADWFCLSNEHNWQKVQIN